MARISVATIQPCIPPGGVGLIFFRGELGWLLLLSSDIIYFVKILVHCYWRGTFEGTRVSP